MAEGILCKYKNTIFMQKGLKKLHETQLVTSIPRKKFTMHISELQGISVVVVLFCLELRSLMQRLISGHNVRGIIHILKLLGPKFKVQ